MPIFTFDSKPEIGEIDGKFTVNLPDEMAVEATKFNELNTQFTDASNTATSYKAQIDKFGDDTPETIGELKIRLQALNEKGDPEELKLNLAKYQREVENLKNSNKDLLGQNESYKTSINSNKINKKIMVEAKEQNIDIETYRSTLDFFSDEFSINDKGDIISNGNGRSGINAGLPVSEFLKEAQAKGYKYLSPSSNGGKGASLEGGKKPSGNEAKTYKELMGDIWKDK